MKKDKRKKKKIKKAALPPPEATVSDEIVMLGVRMSITERDRIKMYALAHHTSVATLIREYIASLPSSNSN